MSLKHRSPEKIGDALKRWLKSSRGLVILGVGNPLRRDDYAGLRAIELLQSILKHKPKVHLIRCDSIPENYFGTIEKFNPSHVLIVDAADAGLQPGSIFHSSMERTEGIAFSTHNIPLKIFARFISRMTGSRVALLAVQPADVGFGEGLSPQVEEAVSNMTYLLKAILNEVFK